MCERNSENTLYNHGLKGIRNQDTANYRCSQEQKKHQREKKYLSLAKQCNIYLIIVLAK